MNTIYQYTDHRNFLKDFYQIKKKKNKSFSYAVFSRRAGLNSPNYLKRVIDGSRNITPRTIRHFITGLDLSKKEADYFTNLVWFNQSSALNSKEYYFGELKKTVQKEDNAVFKIDSDYYDYLSNWYYVAIHEMVNLKDFQEDPEWIQGRLKNKVSKPQVKKALEQLLRMKLLKRDEMGRLQQIFPQLEYQKEVVSLAIQNFHQQMIDLAKASITEDERNEREPSGLTLCIRKSDYPMIKSKIEDLRKELNEKLSCQPKEGEEVLQINIQLFYLTKSIEGRKK